MAGRATNSALRERGCTIDVRSLEPGLRQSVAIILRLAVEHKMPLQAPT